MCVYAGPQNRTGHCNANKTGTGGPNLEEHCGESVLPAGFWIGVSENYNVYPPAHHFSEVQITIWRFPYSELRNSYGIKLTHTINKSTKPTVH